MAKKQSKAPARTGFMVRLPDWHKDQLAQLKKKNRRPTTEEIQIALEKHYRDEGLTQPGTST